jgi:hypothetical protein
MCRSIKTETISNTALVIWSLRPTAVSLGFFLYDFPLVALAAVHSLHTHSLEFPRPRPSILSSTSPRNPGMTVPQPMAPADSPTADSTQQIIVIPALPNATGSSTSTITFDASSGAARTAKPKQRSSAARRASHNAIERLRRENLNSRFLVRRVVVDRW